MELQSSNDYSLKQEYFLLLLIGILGVNALGLTHDIFNVDSALYASISKYMINADDYINIIVLDKDWLDKPHFPFWICALSMKLLGINSFAYKLPSFIFFGIGLFYTYKLALKLYSKSIAQYSVLITGTALHIIISNNDVRAEAILLGLIMGGVYHMYCLSQHFTYKHLILATIFSGCAVMTKGIFILIILYSAIFGDFVLKNQWKNIFQKRWLALLFITVVLTLPEIYALYVQFDAHPEKEVFGRTNVSGIKFFFWDSQFGRFFNSGPIKGSGDPFFFLHTLLWAYAPWALIAYAGAFLSLYRRVKGKIEKEYITLSGFGVIFIIFSVSKFQLPHYTNIVLPLLAIHTAKTIIEWYSNKKWMKYTVNISLNLYSALYFVLAILLVFVYFYEINYLGLFIGIMLLLSIVYFNSPKSQSIKNKIVIMGIVNSMLFGFYMNQVFYKDLLTYQGAIKAAEYVDENFADRDIKLLHRNWLFEFYLKNRVRYNFDEETIHDVPVGKRPLLFMAQYKYDTFKEENIPYHVVKTFDTFHITLLNGTFLNSSTRSEALNKFYLVDLNTDLYPEENKKEKL